MCGVTRAFMSTAHPRRCSQLPLCDSQTQPGLFHWPSGDEALPEACSGSESGRVTGQFPGLSTQGLVERGSNLRVCATPWPPRSLPQVW